MQPLVTKFARSLSMLGALMAAALLAGCATVDLSPHLQPLAKDTLMLLGMRPESD